MSFLTPSFSKEVRFLKAKDLFWFSITVSIFRNIDARITALMKVTMNDGVVRETLCYLFEYTHVYISSSFFDVVMDCLSLSFGFRLKEWTEPRFRRSS